MKKESLRDRSARFGKRSLIVLVLVAAGVAVFAQVPDWLEQIPKIEPVFVEPSVADIETHEAIPEPTTMALLGMGGAALVYRRARSKDRA